jgi:aspartyl-tRNA(Asn)/glutamyl-tRNA(Gln) amidotransferase subunit B
MKYEPVIGLEVHVQLNTQSGMFCRCKNEESSEPNVNICEICTGQPGAMPVINMEAVRKAVMVGLALNCKIERLSKFDRKNYFYPDLPKGYQISQLDHPINGKGSLDIIVDGKVRTIGITRAHLEEDAGKLMHVNGASLVDYNRAGTPLLEIVSDPDIKNSQEASAYLQDLQNIVRYLGVSDADMEKGQLRCDANISLRKVGETGLPPYKVEVKNMNSFKAVVAAIEYEIIRQGELLDAGETPKNETRGWIDADGTTVSQRSKEESQDYRYFPEPDLPTLEFTPEWLADIQRRLPELPKARQIRFVADYNITKKDAALLVSYKELGSYFENVMSELSEWLVAEKAGDGNTFGQTVVNWVLGTYLSAINEHKMLPAESKVTPENFAELVKLVMQGKVSALAAKEIFAKMFETGEDPSNLLESMGLEQVSDESVIVDAVRKVITTNPKAVEDAKIKGEKAFGFLVGQTMKELKGKGNPQIINEILKKELGK